MFPHLCAARFYMSDSERCEADQLTSDGPAPEKPDVRAKRLGALDKRQAAGWAAPEPAAAASKDVTASQDAVSGTGCPASSEADVDRLVETGAITPEMAKLMKSSIRKAKAPPTPASSEADVDRLVATGAITPEMAKLMKSSIRKAKAPPTPASSEADVDRLVATGAITPEMAKLMKSSIRKAKAPPTPASSEADVDRLVATGAITPEMAKLMKSSIRKAKAPPTPASSEADVDRLVATGAITPEMAKLMKSSIRKAKAPPTPASSEADVDRLVATGVITREIASLMRSSIRKAKAPPSPASSEADVDRLVETGVITGKLSKDDDQLAANIVASLNVCGGGGDDDWLNKHMPTWLIEALRTWPDGWHGEQEAKVRREQAALKTLKNELKREAPISSEDYVGSLREPEVRGFHAASVVLTNQGRALMLFDRSKPGAQVTLCFPAGKRNRMEESAWECACQEAIDGTGGLAQMPTTPPSHVAWVGATKMALFVSETTDDKLAERIQHLRRPPEGIENLLPLHGILSAAWVPLSLLGSESFQMRYLSSQAQAVMSVMRTLLDPTRPNWTPVPHTQPESRWVVDISRPFSEGGFGIVYRGRDKGETGEEAPKDCAAKKLGLATQQEIENFQKERAMLQRVGGHESIIELYGSVEAPEAATGWLFLEVATGGELFDHLNDCGRLSERTHRQPPASCC